MSVSIDELRAEGWRTHTTSNGVSDQYMKRRAKEFYGDDSYSDAWVYLCLDCGRELTNLRGHGNTHKAEARRAEIERDQAVEGSPKKRRSRATTATVATEPEPPALTLADIASELPELNAAIAAITTALDAVNRVVLAAMSDIERLEAEVDRQATEIQAYRQTLGAIAELTGSALAIEDDESEDDSA